MSPASVRRETHVCSPCIPAALPLPPLWTACSLGSFWGWGCRVQSKDCLQRPVFLAFPPHPPGSLSFLKSEPFGGSILADISSGSAHGRQDLRVDCPMCLGQGFSGSSWPRGSRDPGILGTCGFGPGVIEVTSGDKWPVTTCAPLSVMLVREVGQASNEGLRLNFLPAGEMGA